MRTLLYRTRFFFFLFFIRARLNETVSPTRVTKETWSSKQNLLVLFSFFFSLFNFTQWLWKPFSLLQTVPMFTNPIQKGIKCLCLGSSLSLFCCTPLCSWILLARLRFESSSFIDHNSLCLSSCRGILAVQWDHKDPRARRESLESLEADIWWAQLSLDSDFHLNALASSRTAQR